MNQTYSILYPNSDAVFKTLSDVTIHDIGLDALICQLTSLDKEQRYIKQVLSRITDDVVTAKFRSEVFEDILRNKDMRDKMTE